MLDDVRDYLQQELRLPEIRGEDCVHAHIETASCRACVEICPKHAWQLSDESLGIDTEACDGCGLCAPVCPQGAILHDHFPFLRQFNQSVIALVACERAVTEPGKGVIPCIHAFSLEEILKLYQKQEVRGFLVCHADCSQCPRHSTLNLSTQLEQINVALAQRKQTGLVYRDVSIDIWREQRDKLSQPVVKGPEVSRRNFLRLGAQQVVQETLKAKGMVEEKKFVPPGALLSASDTAIFPYVPYLQPELCNGCDACLQVCPHRALLLDLEQARYVVNAENCSNCLMCQDVCAQKAIQVVQWAIPHAIQFSLHTARCKHCGRPFHRPVEYQADASTCHVCSQVNHYRNLFQVHD